MNEQRYASLSGQLLARKGAARPAMRPRPLTTSSMEDLGWDDMGFDSGHNRMPGVNSLAALTPAPRPQAVHADIHEDLHQDLHELPVTTPVHEQQQAIAESFAHETYEELGVQAVEETGFEPEAYVPAPVAPEPSQVVKMPRRAAGTTGRKAAFTLRLDADRHLKLRLATAVTGRSAQLLVTEALDQFIDSLPEIGSLASHLPARSGH